MNLGAKMHGLAKSRNMRFHEPLDALGKQTSSLSHEVCRKTLMSFYIDRAYIVGIKIGFSFDVECLLFLVFCPFE